ncbi:fibronectin type III domain-containing protein [Paenibacillus swuensis]|uniref:fibronectin type III domain-containing protein n=1 Tax=Paenibacillus swuensis TaxID=1178515 RepID=UPI000838E63A|nr:discoidin domain-containing protein [Paenibacillus swuensis]
MKMKLKMKQTMKLKPIRTLMAGILLLSASPFQVLAETSEAPPLQAPAASQTVTAATYVTDSPRDPWLQPFSQDSIWNTPIGSGADYQPANLPGQGYVHSDDEWHFKTYATDPVRTIYSPGGWTDRCQGTKPGEGEATMHIADDILVADTITTGGVYETPNNVSTFLKPDGRSLISIEPLCRNVVGGPVYGYQKMPNEDIQGTGIYGTHWGSGLSGFGGSLRHGELTGDAPISHVLKLNVWGKYLYYNAAEDTTPGFRWPADRSDSYASGNYKGANPKLQMGALMAIQPGETVESLGLTSEVGKKFFHALQDYGAYIADDTGWDAYAFSLSTEARHEFEEHYGFSFNQSGGQGASKAYYDDMVKLISKLHIVDNSAPDTIGGGGERRAPLVNPAFREMDAEAPSTPTALTVESRTTNSVTLSWVGSTDNTRVMEYEIWNGSKKAGSTYGATTFTVKGLKKASAYTFKIRAKDTNLNNSAFSDEVRAQTFDGYAENFDSNTAAGWALNNGSLEYGRLKLTGWGSEGNAFYTGRAFSAGAQGKYIYNVALQTDGADNYGKTRVYFNRQDADNTYYVQFGGGETNTVELVKVINGTAASLATYSSSFSINKWDWPVIGVTYSAGGSIKVTGTRGGAETVLFDQVTDTSFTSGQVGVGAAGTQSFADNVSVLVDSGLTGPDTEAPTSPGSLQAAELTTTLATLTWQAAEDNVGVSSYNVYVNGELQGFTELTAYAVKNLTKATNYTFRVEAVDGTGNKSVPAELSVTTPAVDSKKTYTQAFDGTALEGWSLSQAELSGGTLQTGNWGGDALAVYTGDSFSGDVRYEVDVNAWGTGDANLIRVFFQYQDAGNSYLLETGGNDNNTLKLYAITGGNRAELGTFSNYSLKAGAKLIIQIKDGKLTVTGRQNATDTVLFDGLDAAITFGTIALGAQYNFAFFDNLTIESVISDVEAPSSPSALRSLYATEDAVSLEWTAATDNVGVAGYDVYRDGVKVGSAASTGWTATGLAGSTSYTFTVTAKDRAGNVSPASEPLTVKTKASTRLPRTAWTATSSPSFAESPAANAFDGVASTRWSSGQSMAGGQTFTLDLGAKSKFNRIVLDASGSANDYAPGYEVYVSQDGTTWGSAVAVGTGNTVTDIAFKNVDARYIRIVQTGTSGSWWSIHEMSVHLEPDLQPPSAPTALKATRITDYIGVLKWTPSTDNDGVKHYEVYVDGRKVLIVKHPYAPIIYLKKKETHSFAIKAVDHSGNVSPLSAPLTVKLSK